MCAVDRSEDGKKVLEAAKATGEPVLAVHVANSMIGTSIPALIEDGGETDRHIEHGPTGDGLLRAVAQHEPELLVLGTRARVWPSVARYVTRRARCPVLVVGPRADPAAPPIKHEGFDRRVLRRATTPVLIAPRAGRR